MNRVLNFTALAVSSAISLACGELNAAVLQTLTETVNGIKWSYTVSNGVAIVGNDTVSPRPLAIPEATSGTITIPSTLGGCPVTRIGSGAFSRCYGLTVVTIPDSVTSIGDSAFSVCSGLTSVTIGNSVTSIGVGAFGHCSGLTSITIPDSVTIIGNSAFSNCSGITGVTIGRGVTSIGSLAFSGCSRLTSVTIPDGVTNIAMDAFDKCPCLWAEWYRSLAEGRAYNLTQTTGDRAIASVTVSADSAIDSFVLKGGKVYDSVLYINNTADHAVTLSLPSGHVYKAIKGATPLRIPSNTQCILSITRVAEQVFIVSREDLETIQ